MSPEEEKFFYYLLSIESVLLSNVNVIQILKEQLKEYEDQEEYMACAGIKMGIEFARFKTLIDLYKQQRDDN